MHHFNDMNAATAFAHSDELRAAMANAGVKGPPEIRFGDYIEYTLF
jgi:hypothetical protein